MGDDGTPTALLLATTGAGPADVVLCNRGEAPAEVELLIAATWTVAARTGSFEPSVREILQEAGISTKAFYRHFPSKDELLLVALEAGSLELVAYIESRMARFEQPLDRIGGWIEGFLQHVALREAAPRYIPSTLGVGRLATLHPDHFDRCQALLIAPLVREITDAVARGAAHSPSPAKDARIIYGYTMDAIRRHLVHRIEPAGSTIRELVDFTYRALGAS